MFEDCETTTEQGNIAEAYAIAHFTKVGAVVSKPLFVNSWYDLIVDANGTLYRVQVKSTKQRSPDSGVYVVNLKTSGANARKSVTRPFNVEAIDILFVLAEDGTCWTIPTSAFKARHTLALNEDWEQYKIVV